MSNCIESTYYNGKGYARYYNPITKKTFYHHRLVYCDFHCLPMSSIKGLSVCHKCDVPNCINPLHLFLGTRADNNRDKVNKGRQVGAKGITNSHVKLTEADVLAIRGSSLSRVQLAEKYNVTTTTIYDVFRRKTWKHI